MTSIQSKQFVQFDSYADVGIALLRSITLSNYVNDIDQY